MNIISLVKACKRRCCTSIPQNLVSTLLKWTKKYRPTNSKKKLLAEVCSQLSNTILITRLHDYLVHRSTLLPSSEYSCQKTSTIILNYLCHLMNQYNFSNLLSQVLGCDFARLNGEYLVRAFCLSFTFSDRVLFMKKNLVRCYVG